MVEVETIQRFWCRLVDPLFLSWWRDVRQDFGPVVIPPTKARKALIEPCGLLLPKQWSGFSYSHLRIIPILAVTLNNSRKAFQ